MGGMPVVPMVHHKLTCLEDCTVLKTRRCELVIPPGTSTISNGAFQGLTHITAVTLPRGVVSIGDYAFQGCRFTSIILPRTVTTIGCCAFNNCSGLTTICLPATVETIGELSFADCPALASVTIVDREPSLVFVAWALSNARYRMFYTRNVLRLIVALSQTTHCSALSRIGKSAFRNCCSLTTLCLPPSVSYVGEGAFQDCFGLTKFDAAGLRHIQFGASAFYGCTGLGIARLTELQALCAEEYSPRHFETAYY